MTTALRVSAGLSYAAVATAHSLGLAGSSPHRDACSAHAGQMRVSLDHVPPPFRAIFDEMNAQAIDMCSLGLVNHGLIARPNMAVGDKDMAPEVVTAVDAFKRLFLPNAIDFSTLHFMNMPTQDVAMPMALDGSDIRPMGIVEMPGFLCMDTRMLTSKTESGGDNRALKHFKSPKWRSQPHVCPHMAPGCHYRLVCSRLDDLLHCSRDRHPGHGYRSYRCRY